MFRYTIKKFIAYYLFFGWLHDVFNIVKFIFQYLKVKSVSQSRFTVHLHDIYPCLKDNTGTTGFDAHYLYHPAWAARKIFEIKPKEHVDVSSILCFSTILSAFVPTKFYDFRPANITLDNLICGAEDLTKLSFETNSIESLSCMHTLEHVGLGRYGDPINLDLDVIAMQELSRVVRPQGHLFIVTPIGKPKIMFNAHRIYSYDMIVEHFPNFELKEFSLVLDNSEFKTHATKAMADQQNYGCGCFWFVKKNIII